MRSLSGKTTDAEMESAQSLSSSSAPPVCIFKLVVFPVCNKNSSVCGARILRSPAAPSATPAGRTAPSGVCWEHRCWMELGRSLPGGRPAWTCSPVSPERNTHEPRALLTLLSPGVQMRVTSLKKAGLGFQEPKSFFFFF